MAQPSDPSVKQVPKWKRNTEHVGIGEKMGEGDSYLVQDFLPSDLEPDAFDCVKEEVQWQRMYHHGGEVPRLVAVEGEIHEDGWFPIYRHPSDQSPPLMNWSPTVRKIQAQVEKVLGHPVNHVLIQLYRSGNDYISEHSDKTIDVVRGSNIVNVSLGAQRTMILRQKKDGLLIAREEAAGEQQADVKPTTTPRIERPAQRIAMPHNSMFVLGPESNKKWLHSIRQDKRADFLKNPEELAFSGERISLTFRYIGTWLSPDQQRIYGQGATAKTKEEARAVINANPEEAQKMIDAFGFENQRSDFDWELHYGAGFDVLHFSNPQQAETQLPKPLLYYVNGSIPSWRVQMALHEKGVVFDQKRLKVMSQPKETRLPAFLELNHRGKTPVLVDGDTTINESIAILHYIETYHEPTIPLLPPLAERAARARVLARIQETENLHSIYDALEDAHFDAANGVTGPLSDNDRMLLVHAVETELEFWEKYASEEEGGFISGSAFSLADCAFFPFLRYMMRRGFEWNGRWPNLRAYHDRVWQRDCAKKSQPEGWEGRGRANVFSGTRGGAQGLYDGHSSPTT